MHVFWAACSAGPLNVIPSTTIEPSEFTNRPLKPTPPPGPAVGSGKFETPLARMHFDSATGEFAGPYRLEEALGVEPEPPQERRVTPG